MPTSFSPAKQSATFTHDIPRDRPGDRVCDLYIYDSTNDGTDELQPRARRAADAGKNGAWRVANLAPGQWADIKVTLDRRAAGQTAGFY